MSNYAQTTVSTDIQFLKSHKIESNSEFFYNDKTSNNYHHRIKLDPENETKIDLRNQIPTHHCKRQGILKEIPCFTEQNYDTANYEDLDAFAKAEIEAEVTKHSNHHKYQTLLQKEKYIQGVTNKKLKEIREQKYQEKMKLKEELTKLIRETLLFSRKNNPITSMLPNSINHMISQIKEDKGLNISINSLNQSHVSKQSTRSLQKYESNVFLKELGWDLMNLSPDNIIIDIDKAVKFVDYWKTSRKVSEVLRYKIVNELMSIEEKRASQKVEIINKKLNLYKKKKKEEKWMKMKNQIAEALKADAAADPKKKIRDKMRKSVHGGEGSFKAMNQKKGISVEVRKKATSPQPQGRRLRKNKRLNTVPVEKKIVRLNSYNQVDKIWKIIHQSESWSENTTVCKHFINIKYQKKMNEMTSRLIQMNKLEMAGDLMDVKYV